jgi:hypothetical protein
MSFEIALVLVRLNHGFPPHRKRELRERLKPFDRQNLCAMGAPNQYLARTGAGDFGASR